jgi:anaerobic ribonucleoside-triphosphate reductase activating protein
VAHYNPWSNGGLPYLNVAHICPATRALGPGLRAVVWVQGCCFHCPGCIAPEWIPWRIVRLMTPEEVVSELLAHPEVTGLTFSGGEPMLQAAGLAAVARLARRQRDLSIICYTGFTLEQLRTNPPGPGVEDLLDAIDVLIDGPYIEELNDQQGLRGSANQRIHYLTDRLRGFDFAHTPRRIEIFLEGKYALLVGIPTSEQLAAFERALTQSVSLLGQRTQKRRFTR